MYLVLIAWFYVALMMAVAEATSPVGTVLGAVFTFLLYGALPMLVVGVADGGHLEALALVMVLLVLLVQVAKLLHLMVKQLHGFQVTQQEFMEQ